MNLAIYTITASVSPFISSPPQFPHVDTDLTVHVMSSVALRAERVKSEALTHCVVGRKPSVIVAPLESSLCSLLIISLGKIPRSRIAGSKRALVFSFFFFLIVCQIALQKSCANS